MNGIGEEPLAENHFIIKCNVGEEKKLPIIIQNTESAVKDYTVTIDAYGITGPQKIKVDPQAKSTYNAIIKPVLGGVYAGCITFTDQNRHYIWYTFELEF